MSEEFQPKKKFINPLQSVGKKTYSKKFASGSIFTPAFIKAEQDLSKIKKTVVFDLDETLRGWDEETHLTFLRHSLKKVLDTLIDRNYRLIIWSSSVKDSIQQTLNRYPEFEHYFDLIISAENVSFKFISNKNQDDLKKISPQYYKDMMKTTGDEVDKSTGRSIRRIPKNISLFGYHLIIDDDPSIIDEGIKYHFKAFRIFPYKYDNPEYRKMIPTRLGKILDDDFSRNLVKYIENEVEDVPLEHHPIYIIG